MIADSFLTEEQMVQQATDVLMSKLGLVETFSFLALTTRGRIESVERHRAWPATLDKDAFFDEVFSGTPKTWSVPGRHQ
jgi:hypothetical protein